MDLQALKNTLLGNLTPEARKLVIAYAMQSAVLTQIEVQAVKAGASRTKLEMVKGALPMLLGYLLDEIETAEGASG